jgi:carbamoyl-phosphate synthase small subunit
MAMSAAAWPVGAAEVPAARASSGQPALLVLEDGTVFRGRSIGAAGTVLGEAVFNTGMAGYQEVLTDPSYRRQIVAMTAPHVGNYGLNAADMESDRIQVAGFVVKEAARRPSSWRAEQDLRTALVDAEVVGIEGIDTRKLTRHLRDRGAMRAGLSTEVLDVDALREQVQASPGMQGAELASEVTTAQAYVLRLDADGRVVRLPDRIGTGAWAAVSGTRGGVSGPGVAGAGAGPGTAGSGVAGAGAGPGTAGSDGAAAAGALPAPRFRVVALDFGMKRSIGRYLAEQGAEVHVLPATATADDVLARDPDGLFLSNGPGDPATVAQGIATTSALLGRVPTFGICLGSQLVGHALGADTYKLVFGHRGVNQPVLRRADGVVEITSHNHGFAVQASSLGEQVGDHAFRTADHGVVEVSHVNLNDDVVEGLTARDLPAFSVQYHPEAAPGPTDARYLFARFSELIEAHRAGRWSGGSR